MSHPLRALLLAGGIGVFVAAAVLWPPFMPSIIVGIAGGCLLALIWMATE